jgi:MFS family permease
MLIFRQQLFRKSRIIPQMISRYITFFEQPGVARMVSVAFASRLPVGMLGLSMLLFLRESLGSFSLAGSAVGACYIAMAICAPMQGRFIDRYGPHRLLWVTGFMQPFALIALYASAAWQWSFTLVMACAVLSGAFQSPITVLTRTLWRHRFDDEEARRLAYAVDAVMIECNFTIGPAIVAAVLAFSQATSAFLLSIAMVIAGFALFMKSGVLRYWKREHHAERHLLGPLREPRLLLVYAISFGLTFCFGLLEVGYPGYATALGLSAVGGVLLAVNAAGSATGGAIFGALHLRTPIERQFAVTLALMSLPLFLHAFLIDQRIVFSIVAFFAGMAIAPSLTSQTVLVSRLAPGKYATEAFTWSSTFILTGIGAGMSVGGILMENADIKLVFALGGAIALAMAGLALLLPVTSARIGQGEPARQGL